MTRKLSTITTAKVVILSETTKQMTEKASHASRAGGSKSSFYLFHLRMTHSWNGCAASPAAAFVQNGYTVAGAGMLSAARRMRSLRSRSAPFSCPASSSVKPPLPPLPSMPYILCWNHGTDFSKYVRAISLHETAR